MLLSGHCTTVGSDLAPSAISFCRCHTSAHQAELLRKGEKTFLVTGDVYRRDSVDRTHYPVFHQMEGFRVFTPEEIEASGMSGELVHALNRVTQEGQQFTSLYIQT